MPYVIVALTLGILAALSLAAERRWRMHARLPMQWGVRGQVNWTAPRRIALAFTPTLAAVMLFGPLVLSDTAITRPIAIGSAAFIFAHLLHLALLARWHRKISAEHAVKTR